MQQRANIVRLVVTPLALITFGLLTVDMLTCMSRARQLDSAANAGAHAGLRALTRPGARDADAIAAAQRIAEENLGALFDSRITVQVGADQRSVAVNISRPGSQCVSQACGLTAKRDAFEVASLPLPGSRPLGSPRMCVASIC